MKNKFVEKEMQVSDEDSKILTDYLNIRVREHKEVERKKRSRYAQDLIDGIDAKIK